MFCFFSLYLMSMDELYAIVNFYFALLLSVNLKTVFYFPVFVHAREIL